MSKKILVTGAAGFIGFHLVERLVKQGDIVVGIDNINDYYDNSLKYDRLKESGINKEDVKWLELVTSYKNPNYKFSRMNLEDQDSLFSLCRKEKFDAIVNLAAQAGVRYSIENPYSYIQSNVVGFINILEAVRNFKIGHLVYASSSSTYGLNTKMPFSVNDQTDHPVSLYAATKKSNELMAHAYSHLYNIPTTGLRFFTVYGPWGRPDMAYFIFANSIKDNKPIKVFNHGNMKRDFTYIDDIIEGIVNVIDSPAVSDPNWMSDTPSTSSSSAPYKVYNIGNNTPVKLLDFIQEIENQMGIKANIIMEEMQDGDVQNTWADIDELINDFGYKPAISISEGLATFTNWYKSYYKIGKN